MQAQPLLRGAPCTTKYLHSTILLFTQPNTRKPWTRKHIRDSSHTCPHTKATQTQITKPSPTPHPTYTNTTTPPATKPHKHCPVLYHRHLEARMAKAMRRATHKDKSRHTIKQHPLSDYWPTLFHNPSKARSIPPISLKSNARIISTP
jgi:hypothetical protein